MGVPMASTATLPHAQLTDAVGRSGLSIRYLATHRARQFNGMG
jgi:hypothetical protein